ncbi:probable GTP-binding protein [Rhynchosporium graminicola]|nr:probable GTP-binding protein [Rhynchosporium commune]
MLARSQTPVHLEAELSRALVDAGGRVTCWTPLIAAIKLQIIRRDFSIHRTERSFPPVRAAARNLIRRAQLFPQEDFDWSRTSRSCRSLQLQLQPLLFSPSSHTFTRLKSAAPPLLTSITTSSFTTPRLFTSFSSLTFKRSAARTATEYQSLLSCTVLINSDNINNNNNNNNNNRNYNHIQTRSYAKKKMPPKKPVKEEKLLLGRPGNNLKSGIVGLANVGKSTLFQAITKCHLGNPANFPFATIDPEESRVIVPDERYDWLCEKYNPKSRVPAHLTIYDIAGLTRGASSGAGLGNAFLSHIRAVDAIFQVVRCFDDAEIIHIEGDVDPVRDLTIISEELRIKDIEFTEKALEASKKLTRRGGQSLEMKKLKEEEACIEKVLALLQGGGDVRKGDWTVKEIEYINPLFLLTAKPVVYLINLSEKDYIRKKNKHLAKVMEWIKEHAAGDPILPISICLEERLTQFEGGTEGEEAKKELKELGVESALPKLITTMRKVLDLGSFFTTGTDEVRQWTIRNGTKAPQAAGVIHGDFEKTFIQAIVYNFIDLKELGDEAEIKAKGKIQTKGKEYVVQDGDIVLFKAGAAKG